MQWAYCLKVLKINSLSLPKIKTFFRLFISCSSFEAISCPFKSPPHIKYISPIFSNSFAATYGIIPGSFLASKLSGEFKIRMPKNPVRLFQSFGGGLFMGYGAGLAIGCTLGSFFSAIPSMSLSGWLFGLSLAIGAFFGTKIISRI